MTVNPTGWFLRMLLPAIALAVPVIGQMTRVVRTSMVEELDRDYVRTAVGAGIPKRIVVARNVLRNALITPVTVLGLRVGYLMGGAVVIEIIFSINGMGKAVLLKGIQENWVTWSREALSSSRSPSSSSTSSSMCSTCSSTRVLGRCEL